MIEIGKGGWNEMLKFLLGYENLVNFFFLLNWVRPRGLDRPTIYLLGKGTAPPMTIDMLPCLVRQLIPVTRCRCIHRRCLSSRSNQKWIEKQIIPLQFPSYNPSNSLLYPLRYVNDNTTLDKHLKPYNFDCVWTLMSRYNCIFKIFLF
jgi:hypothetical protein